MLCGAAAAHTLPASTRRNGTRPVKREPLTDLLPAHCVRLHQHDVATAYAHPHAFGNAFCAGHANGLRTAGVHTHRDLVIGITGHALLHFVARQRAADRPDNGGNGLARATADLAADCRAGGAAENAADVFGRTALRL